ncbi:hypothetical protein ACA910_016783 [Epithemia clementina (nom. ined.)]
MDFPTWFQELCNRLDNSDTTLSNLNLNIRRVDQAMMEELSRVLHKSPSLVVLNLTSAITDHPDAILPLVNDALPRTSSLQILHLSYNQIQNTRGLGSCLAANCSLVELYLDYNAINSQGASHIAEGLKCNHTLAVLQMNYNFIGDEGATEFSRALVTNKSLQRLNLLDNGIKKKGGLSLLLALESNMSLQFCQMEGNLASPLHTGLINIICRANKAGRQILAKPDCAGLISFVLSRVV